MKTTSFKQDGRNGQAINTLTNPNPQSNHQTKASRQGWYAITYVALILIIISLGKQAMPQMSYLKYTNAIASMKNQDYYDINYYFRQDTIYFQYGPSSNRIEGYWKLEGDTIRTEVYWIPIDSVHKLIGVPTTSCTYHPTVDQYRGDFSKGGKDYLFQFKPFDYIMIHRGDRIEAILKEEGIIE